jgi:hypothetical protein
MPCRLFASGDELSGLADVVVASPFNDPHRLERVRLRF